MAHARMLAKQGIIADEDAAAIVEGLERVKQEIEAEDFPWDASLEDLHMNIERRLHDLIGPAAGRLHTGRSRNDQIALDMRLYTREVIADAVAGLRNLQRALLGRARQYQAVVMPGYTHLQRAQPVLFAHHMLAYFEMFQRDIGRLEDCRRRADVLPLGSGALAGVPYPTDREFLARELGFSRISANSMDAVSDRDFVVEFMAAAALCMMHFSRMSEELILWASGEFGFIRLSRRVHHRQQHHAAETQPRLRRIGPRQNGTGLWRPDWSSDDPEGTAPHLQPGLAGRQGRFFRHGGHAADDPRGVCGYAAWS